jgi:hypothetical protein
MLRALSELFLAFRQSRVSWKPQQTQLGRDRRRFHRVSIRVACRMNNRMYGMDTSGMLVNLSLGGAGFTAPAKWPEGNRVRVFIDEFRFVANAIIVFRGDGESDFLYGVKFERMGLKNILKLRRILRRHFQGSLTL